MNAFDVPNIVGFTCDEVPALLVMCDRCSTDEVFFGFTADWRAMTWAREHLMAFHPEMLT